MIRDWLIANVETVTRVAVAIICLLGAAVAFVVLAGLTVAFRPDGGYAVEVFTVALAVTFLHVQAGQPAGRHAIRTVAP